MRKAAKDHSGGEAPAVVSDRRGDGGRPFQGGCLGLWALTLMILGVGSAWAESTNWYHAKRSFRPMERGSGSPTWHKVISEAYALTGIVGPFHVKTTGVCAVEYDAGSWGYTDANNAWQAALGVEQTKRVVYEDRMFDNVGWVNGTKESDGTWGAYAWLLQNEVSFESSTSTVYMSKDGVTNLISCVMVGTIGDYCPMTRVLDIGPARNTNFPGAGMFTNGTFKGDFRAYYKLVGDFTQEANTDDSDNDGVPDFADGYDLDGFPARTIFPRTTRSCPGQSTCLCRRIPRRPR